MISQKNLNRIKEITQEFFKKMSFDIQIEFLPQEEFTLPIRLKSDEPRILIGERGETLFEIQHLLTVILKKEIDDENSFYIDIDINDYKKKKIKYLKELAQSFANECFLTKKEKNFPPMSSFERRIIHLELADNPNVTTESIGQEPSRRIVIKPR